MATSVRILLAGLNAEQREMAERYHALMGERGAQVMEHLRPGLLRYFILRIKPGDFLRCVLINDLRGAVMRADAPTFIGLKDLVTFLNMHAPGTSWGSTYNVDEWLSDENPTLVPPTE